MDDTIPDESNDRVNCTLYIGSTLFNQLYGYILALLFEYLKLYIYIVYIYMYIYIYILYIYIYVYIYILYLTYIYCDFVVASVLSSAIVSPTASISSSCSFCNVPTRTRMAPPLPGLPLPVLLPVLSWSLRASNCHLHQMSHLSFVPSNNSL